ncbi:sulfatase-like hydrolase/transferase [Halosolutus halophilus]|uniref:sulfatase-like hydrolase/transferase n=1 Tax=Halosolutus halophilus TaxID=1552990 RepID=UPI0022352C44|nr:sulfatase-like hydrolase/transferase [Halosolutus halophilus]
MDNAPDILWLSLESVRADHTPMYGYKRDTTPSLDRFASQPATTVFDNGIAQSLWTPASSASMLTGTYLSTHRVGQDGRAEKKLPAAIDTLPELLSDIGYETALFSPNPYVSEATGLDRGFDHTTSVKAVPESYSPFQSDARIYWSEGLRRILRSRKPNIVRIKHELKTTENEVLEHHAKRWLNSTGANADQFFAYMHIPGPHHPYFPNTDYLNCFTDEISFSAEEAYNLVEDIYYGGSVAIKRRMAEGLDLSANEWEAIEAMYDATLRHMDDTVDALISKARSVSDSLVVVVVGDHGELFGEHGLIGHNLILHDNLIEVPMLISGIPDATTDETTLTQQIDLTYTLGEITGVTTDQFEGQDIRNTGRKYAISQRGRANLTSYTQYNNSFDTERFFKDPYTVVRSEEYKLASNQNRTELYRLPDEDTDVKKHCDDVMAELRSVIDREAIEWTVGEQKRESHFGDSQLEQLKDLGYLS